MTAVFNFHLLAKLRNIGARNSIRSEKMGHSRPTLFISDLNVKLYKIDPTCLVELAEIILFKL
jgi:hypothetical protein